MSRRPDHLGKRKEKRVTSQMLCEMLVYDPETGRLVWKTRARQWFKSDRDWRWWNKRFAGKDAFTAIDNKGYAFGRVCDTPFLAHRVAWAVHHGKWPNGQIDHINGHRSDNRIINLRDVPSAENNRNRKISKRNLSGATGVRRSRSRWRAEICVDGNTINLGTHDSFEEAVAARRIAEQAHGFLSRSKANV